MKHLAWHAASLDDVLHSLDTERKGLDSGEAGVRLGRIGENRIPRARPVSPGEIFASQFRSPLIIVLVVAGLISFALGRSLDAVVVFVAIALNVLVGFAQEFRAYRALEALRFIVAFDVVVFRNGREALRPSRSLVPGDVIRISAGSQVPADARLLTAERLVVNEAPLTGESFPVEKRSGTLMEGTPLPDRVNMLYLGTTVLEGSALAVVVATGRATELGATVRLAQETPETPTPLQEQLRSFSRSLTLLILGLSVIIFIVGVLARENLGEMFLTATALAVAAIPEGLLIGVTVVLTVGMQRLLKRKALVRKLVAAETLGATTVICVDKTGTLTEGTMHVAEFVTAAAVFERGDDGGRDERVRWLLEIAMLCNDAFIENEADDLAKWIAVGNPTERALLVAGDKLGLRKTKLDREWRRLASLPFDAERKTMVTLHQTPNNTRILLAKGAPERLLALSDSYDANGHQAQLTGEKRAAMLASFERRSDRGLRLLALAYRSFPASAAHDAIPSDIAGFTFAGFVAIKDPLRADAKEMVQEVQRAGVEVVMMTGDHSRTARAIAREIGLPAEQENIIDGDALALLPDHKLAERIASLRVYARMAPKDKLRIVDAWQAHNAVVAMTGDGVNDAPALRSADIGIALGSGTDLAKETAGIVLLDDDFRTIVEAVREGRMIIENIRKVVLYLLSDSFSAVIIILGSMLAGLPLPLAAPQILWVNLIADGFPHLALAVDPEEEDLLRRRPRRKGNPLVSRDLLSLALLSSLITGAVTLGIFALIWSTTSNFALARTAAFATLGITSVLYIFSLRAMRRPMIAQNPFRNPWLVVAVVAGLAIQILAVSHPVLQRLLGTVDLNAFHWMTVFFTAVVVTGLIEVAKIVVFIRKQPPA